ncbi:NFACT RNA binding domain-containing protein [Sulfurovum sp. zt1-1]|uniref:NFACT RNA binding domain-containing protein n=1 Tax=Sulfurovum zhangzhouensis TaxID=3019067 RepID=A0ABT7QZT7_9BACT|nr:NFACT RNA binding domain-containing protein [Sulfurovum zhangzhouensis]MDM5272354.1 NFACT RNA binding domain-containing protein [Sulfurovum zhangzhouensis]
MKLYELQAIAKRLNDFSFISRARRVEDNTIELVFDKNESYFFNMTRGHSFVYKAPSQRPMQSYNAPFDALLHSLLAASRILSIEVPGDDRILRIKVAPKSSYKDQVVVLQLEFTGKNTNAILLDEHGIIIEALRHIDAQSSFRVIRPGVELLELPPFESKEEQGELNDVDAFLEDNFSLVQSKKLRELKKQKLTATQKKIDKLKQLVDNLPSETDLEAESVKYTNYANLILANLYQIKPYDKKLETYDFEGHQVTIPFPKDIKTNRLSDYYFNLSKRAKNKAKNVHIEKSNLESKKAFYENIYYALEQAQTPYELELLVPKRAKSLRKKEKLKEGELFWIEDYKVLVGRNSTENQKLLQLAKANDVWMHVRDIPSSHVIIRTDKQNLPESVIQAAAKLCVDFSVKNPGDYEVDYTKRKFVKVQEGSNVLYNQYHTIHVTKEGVEIRV